MLLRQVFRGKLSYIRVGVTPKINWNGGMGLPRAAPFHQRGTLYNLRVMAATS